MQRHIITLSLLLCALILPVHGQMLQSIVGGKSTGGGSPWTLINQTALIPVGATGGTTAAIDCTGANLIAINAGWFQSGSGTVTSANISDSLNGFTYTNGPTSPQIAGSLGVASLFYKISPTVSNSMTFTFAPGLPVFGAIQVECWRDGSGTPVADQTNNARTSSASTLQPGSITPTVDNSLIVTGAADGGACTGQTLSVDSGFTIDAVTPCASTLTASGALASLPQSTAAPINPTWTSTSTEPLGAAIMSFKP